MFVAGKRRGLTGPSSKMEVTRDYKIGRLSNKEL